MNKAKLYEEQEIAGQPVGEPVVEYSTIQKNVDYLPSEMLVEAIEYAQIAHGKGQMIPNEEVYGLLSDRLGWTTGSSSFATITF